MSTKTNLLAISLAIVLLPWLLWRIGLVRRVAPLAVVQILVGVALGPSCLGQIAPGLHAALFTRPVLAALDGVSSLGVLLYVFVTALHLDLALLRHDSRSLGAMMQTKGLMEVVVLAALHEAGLIGGPIFSGMVAMAVVCTVLTAPAVRFCQRLEARPGVPNARLTGERI